MGGILLIILILLSAIPGVRTAWRLLRQKPADGAGQPVGAGVLLLVLTVVAIALLLVTHFLGLLV